MERVIALVAAQVGVALGVLDSMARGPLARGAGARLRAACAAVWRTRSLCEAPSLTAHACIEPEQSVPPSSLLYY